MTAVPPLRPAPPRPPVKLLKVGEVAAMFRVSKMTVYRLIHSGDLPALQVGRSFRVPERAAVDFLRGAEVVLP